MPPGQTCSGRGFHTGGRRLKEGGRSASLCPRAPVRDFLARQHSLPQVAASWRIIRAQFARIPAFLAFRGPNCLPKTSNSWGSGKQFAPTAAKGRLRLGLHFSPRGKQFALHLSWLGASLALPARTPSPALPLGLLLSCCELSMNERAGKRTGNANLFLPTRLPDGVRQLLLPNRISPNRNRELEQVPWGFPSKLCAFCSQSADLRRRVSMQPIAPARVGPRRPGATIFCSPIRNGLVWSIVGKPNSAVVRKGDARPSPPRHL